MPWPGILKAIRRTLFDPNRELIRRNRKGQGIAFAIHHPSWRTFLLLARWQLAGRSVIASKVHVACDEKPDELGERMEDLWDLLRFKNASPNARPIRFGALNFYLADYRYQQNMRRNCLVYAKGVYTRTELRFLCADVVKRNGLDDFHELVSANLPALFPKHLHGWEA